MKAVSISSAATPLMEKQERQKLKTTYYKTDACNEPKPSGRNALHAAITYIFELKIWRYC